MSMNLGLYHDVKKQYRDVLRQTTTDMTTRLIKLPQNQIMEEYRQWVYDFMVGESKAMLEKEPRNPHLQLVYDIEYEQYENHMEEVMEYLELGYKFVMV